METFGFYGFKSSGSSLGTDASPNSTPPTRTVRISDRSNVKRGAIFIVANAACTVSVWVYSDDTATWLAVATSVSVSGTSPAVVDGAAYPNANTFVQITANGGGATFIGFQYI